jgi:hypothetical protein
VDPLEELKKIRDDLLKSLELGEGNDTMAVPRLSAYERRERLRMLREVEESLRQTKKP